MHLPTHDFVHYTVFIVLTKCKHFTEFIENFVEIFENLKWLCKFKTIL